MVEKWSCCSGMYVGSSFLGVSLGGLVPVVNIDLGRRRQGLPLGINLVYVQTNDARNDVRNEKGC